MQQYNFNITDLGITEEEVEQIQKDYYPILYKKKNRKRKAKEIEIISINSGWINTKYGNFRKLPKNTYDTDFSIKEWQYLIRALSKTEETYMFTTQCNAQMIISGEQILII